MSYVRVSVVTPNLNRAAFLAQTMDSVLAADPGGLEYVIVDGGSHDASLEVIEQRKDRLAHYTSEPDAGVYDAVNKGFSRTSGEVMGWVNSGDLLFPDSLQVVREIFETFPDVSWITSRVLSFLDESGRLVEQGVHSGIEPLGFWQGVHLPGYSRGRTLSMIQQESTFWRRSLWDKAGGGLDLSLRLAADFALWARFFDHADLWTISAPIGAFRRHREQLSVRHWPAYLEEASRVLSASKVRPKNAILQTLGVGLRRSLPADLRPLAHTVGLMRPAPFLTFSGAGWTQCWR